MHPATMEWIIIQAAVTSVNRPLASKTMDFKRLADELAPDFHETIVNLHLKKMETRGLVRLDRHGPVKSQKKSNAENTPTITFLAKIDELLEPPSTK